MSNTELQCSKDDVAWVQLSCQTQNCNAQKVMWPGCNCHAKWTKSIAKRLTGYSCHTYCSSNRDIAVKVQTNRVRVNVVVTVTQVRSLTLPCGLQSRIAACAWLLQSFAHAQSLLPVHELSGLGVLVGTVTLSPLVLQCTSNCPCSLTVSRVSHLR